MWGYKRGWNSLDSVDQYKLALDIHTGKILDPEAFLRPADERGNPSDALNATSSLFNIHQNTQVMSDRGARRYKKASDLADEIAKKFSGDADTLAFMERELQQFSEEEQENFKHHLSDDYVSESDITRAYEHHLQRVMENLSYMYEHESGGELLINIQDTASQSNMTPEQAERKAEEKQQTLRQEKAANEGIRERKRLRGILKDLEKAGRKDDPEYAEIQAELKQTYIDEGVTVIPLGVESGADVHISFDGKAKMPSEYNKKIESDRRELINQLSGRWDDTLPNPEEPGKTGWWKPGKRKVELEDRRKVLSEVLSVIENDRLPIITTKSDGKGGRNVFVSSQPYPSIHEFNHITRRDQNTRRTSAIAFAEKILRNIQGKERQVLLDEHPELLKRFNALDGSVIGEDGVPGYRGSKRQQRVRVSNYVTNLIDNHPIVQNEKFTQTYSHFESIHDNLVEMILEGEVEHNGEMVSWQDMVPNDNPNVDGYVNDYLNRAERDLEEGIAPSRPPEDPSGDSLADELEAAPPPISTSYLAGSESAIGEGGQAPESWSDALGPDDLKRPRTKKERDDLRAKLGTNYDARATQQPTDITSRPPVEAPKEGTLAIDSDPEAPYTDPATGEEIKFT
jgi:hypothetical protein